MRETPSLTVRPFVLGPDNVPLIATEREARQDVPLAVLSAMTHGRGRKAPAILESLAAALKDVDRDNAAVFVQFVDSCLTDPQAQQMLRDLMTAMQYFWRHPLAQEVREQGREEGRTQERAAAILRTLKWRQIDVPDAVRDRILASTDFDELGAWLDRAYEVDTASDLFDDERT
ncbi:hypothetical protein ABZX99_05375 [Streptomyces antibioticus]|uniref:hypothetical protein n=1 Tax=Streptomyces antibioticus TaxID=1890 RepID=UPI0033A67772